MKILPIFFFIRPFPRHFQHALQLQGSNGLKAKDSSGSSRATRKPFWPVRLRLGSRWDAEEICWVVCATTFPTFLPQNLFLLLLRSMVGRTLPLSLTV